MLNFVECFLGLRVGTGGAGVRVRGEGTRVGGRPGSPRFRTGVGTLKTGCGRTYECLFTWVVGERFWSASDPKTSESDSEVSRGVERTWSKPQSFLKYEQGHGRG